MSKEGVYAYETSEQKIKAHEMQGIGTESLMCISVIQKISATTAHSSPPHPVLPHAVLSCLVLFCPPQEQQLMSSPVSVADVTRLCALVILQGSAWRV